MHPFERYRTLVSNGRLHGDPAQESVAHALEELVVKLDKWGARKRSFFSSATAAKPPRGIYIHGPVGRGKSMLMDIFFEQAGLTPKRRVHFHDFMSEVHKSVKRLREQKSGDPIPHAAEEIFGKSKLLCFDEFQVSDIADAMILSRLLHQLFHLGCVIVATSNRAPAELYENGINRQLFLPAIDAIERNLDVLKLDGPIDYRLAKLERSSVYFSPLSIAAEEKLEQIWSDLTGVHKGEPASLDVMGRALMVPEQAKGAARFTFREICEQSLGPLDFLAIADAYHAVFVKGVPRMGPDQRNEAKRLITLIDALYERNVKLIASAEVSPFELYRAGDGSAEFERTASRLTEMQTAEYLAKAHKPVTVATKPA